RRGTDSRVASGPLLTLHPVGLPAEPPVREERGRGPFREAALRSREIRHPRPTLGSWALGKRVAPQLATGDIVDRTHAVPTRPVGRDLRSAARAAADVLRTRLGAVRCA